MERNHMEDTGVDWAVVLSGIIRMFPRGAIDWIDLA